jgi:hypothetical protein
MSILEHCSQKIRRRLLNISIAAQQDIYYTDKFIYKLGQNYIAKSIVHVYTQYRMLVFSVEKNFNVNSCICP